MAALAQYGDVVAEVRSELTDRLAAAEAAGIAKWNLVQDPGLGFAKTQQHNVAHNSHSRTAIHSTEPARADRQSARQPAEISSVPGCCHSIV